MDTFLGAFTIQPGRCFRMIRDPNPRRHGQATHCPQPVAFRGRFRTPRKTYTVDACEGHAPELEDAQPIGIRQNGRG